MMGDRAKIKTGLADRLDAQTPAASARPAFPLRLDQTSGAPVATKKVAAYARADWAKDQNDTKPQPRDRRLDATTYDSRSVRARMVEKLAGQGVTDPAVLAAMGQVERHHFVDTALGTQAYEDTSLPIGLGQTISKPNVVARMLELLRGGQPAKLGRVLEIGTGCGYQAALLSCLATEVYSMERLRGLHQKAIENLRFLRLPNVHLLYGDGMLGYPRGAPYAAIIVAAGGNAVPLAWTDQLAVGGRLVAPVLTTTGGQALVVIEKLPDGLRKTVLEAVSFVPLKSGLS
jgi:protein-L-isoaspartate(D-aspartate) O-methyltransferase